MTFASITTLNVKNPKILRPKVKKILRTDLENIFNCDLVPKIWVLNQLTCVANSLRSLNLNAEGSRYTDSVQPVDSPQY